MGDSILSQIFLNESEIIIITLLANIWVSSFDLLHPGVNEKNSQE